MSRNETASSNSQSSQNLAYVAKRKRALKGDLDNIVLKALRKEPARRYASVEQFAEDIRRHLQGRPVAATPDSVPYRLGKLARRHKAGTAATVLVAFAIAGGVAATLREARIAVQQRARAERRFNDVRKLANSVLFEFDEAIKNLPGSTPARALVVQRALEYLDGLAAEARGDRSLQLEIASAYQKVAEVQGDPTFPNLGDSKGALQSSRKSLAILETLSREEPGNQPVLLALARNHRQISDVLDFSGDYAGTLDHSAQALKIYQDLAVSLASDPKFQAEQVTQTYHYGYRLQLAGRLDDAVNEYTRAVELSQRMIHDDPLGTEGKVHLSTSLDGLGNVLQERGDTSAALESRRKGLAIREELSKVDPDNAHFRRQLAFSHHNVGLSLMAAGDLASALKNFQTELALFESLSTADPKDMQGRRNRSLAHKLIGDVLMRTNDFRGALAEYRAALNIDRDLVAVDPASTQALYDLSFSEGKVGSALGKLGQLKESLQILRSGVERQEALASHDRNGIRIYNHLASSYTLLADSLLETNDRASAVEYYRKAIAARLVFAQNSQNSGANRAALAQGYANLGKALEPVDREDALQQYGKAIELLDSVVAADLGNAQNRIDLADALSNAARLYSHMDGRATGRSPRLADWKRARSFYQRSRELWVELDKSARIPTARAKVIEELSGELARCDDSLAKLEPVHP